MINIVSAKDSLPVTAFDMVHASALAYSVHRVKDIKYMLEPLLLYLRLLLY